MSEAHLHLEFWPLSLAATSALIITALFYLRGWLRFRRAFPSLIPTWRLAAFIAGLFSVWTAVASPLAELDHQSLTFHMAKHLLLMTAASPLLLAGTPTLPLFHGLPTGIIPSGVLLRKTRWPRCCLPRLKLCWLVGTAAVIGWHLPAAFQLGMRSLWVHSIEDFSFLLAGLLFWWPVVQPSPNSTRSSQWSIPLYLFMATLPCDILSAFLVFCNRLAYPYYLSATQPLSLSPLQDQECAGALMWIWVTFAYLIPAVVITMQTLSPSNTHSQRSVQIAWDTIAVQSLNGAEAEGL
jgi:cytochrome c oxidase assembly factor CtaG